MPCLLKIKVLRARNLPSMDRKSSLTDAYVEIRFADLEPLRTIICKKTLDPVWNEDFRMEVSDDAFLQNEPLELKVIDYDSITADDLIGSVFFDLNVLLMRVFETEPESKSINEHNHSSVLPDPLINQEGLEAGLNEPHSTENDPDPTSNSLHNASAPGINSLITKENMKILEFNNSDPEMFEKQMKGDLSSEESVESFIGETEVVSVVRENARSIGGWFPIFDCQTGIRGELQCQIKLEFFGDVNPFRGSSAGIKIFSMERLPVAQFSSAKLCGFLSASITKSDPEYHWSDSFRTQRVSNESRQRLMYQLSGQLRRKMGRKAIECGANMILGYKHSFDFEEKNKTITARAVGTAVLLELSLQSTQKKHNLNLNSKYIPVDSGIDYKKQKYPPTPSSKKLLPKKSVDSDSDDQISDIILDPSNECSFAKQPKPNYENNNPNSVEFESLHIHESEKNDKDGSHHDSDNGKGSLNPGNDCKDFNEIRSLPTEYHSSADNASIEDSNKSYDSINRAIASISSFQNKQPPDIQKDSDFIDGESRLRYSKNIDEINPNSNIFIQDIVTLKKFPSSTIQRLGGTVMAHSVKVINDDDEKTRQTWWDELRREIKSHAKSLSCTHILGYSESSSIKGDVIVLSVIGTAAVIDTNFLESGNESNLYNFYSKFSNAKLYEIFSKKKLRDPYKKRGKSLNAKLESELRYPSNINSSKIKNKSIDNNIKTQKIQSNKDHPTFLKPGSKSNNTSDSSFMAKNSKILKSKSKRVRPYTFSGFQKSSKQSFKRLKPLGCRMCHSPHDRKSLPYPMRFFRCGYCQKSAVPEIILSTIEPPVELNIIEGEATIVEAHICRSRFRNSVAGASSLGEKSSKLISSSLGKLGIRGGGAESGGAINSGGSDEIYAAFISDSLPFIQYDIHRQLLYKLSVHGMNAIFGLKYHLSLGEDMIIATATGTAVYVTALPTPGPLVISRNIGVWDEEDRGFLKIQNRITNLSIQNRERLDKKFNEKKLTLSKLKNKNPNRIRKNKTRGELQPKKKNLISKGDALDLSKPYTFNIKDKNEPHNNPNNSQDEDESTPCPICGSSTHNRKCKNCGNKLKTKDRSIQASVAVQIDDDADEDLMAALFDHPLNTSFSIVNTDGKLFYKHNDVPEIFHKNGKRESKLQRLRKKRNPNSDKIDVSSDEGYHQEKKMGLELNINRKTDINFFSDCEEEPKGKTSIDKSGSKSDFISDEIVNCNSKSQKKQPSNTIFIYSSSASDPDSDTDSGSSSSSSSSSSLSSSSSDSEPVSFGSKLLLPKKLKNNTKNLTGKEIKDDSDSLLFEPSFHQSLTVAKRVYLDPQSKHPNRLLANIFNQTYQEMCSNLFYFSRCLISAVGYTVNIVDEGTNEVQLLLTATAVGICRFPSHLMIPAQLKGEESDLPDFTNNSDENSFQKTSLNLKKSKFNDTSIIKNSGYGSKFIPGIEIDNYEESENSKGSINSELKTEGAFKNTIESKLSRIIHKISLDESRQSEDQTSSPKNNTPAKLDLLAKNSSFFSDNESENRIQFPLGLDIPQIATPSSTSIRSEYVGDLGDSINQSIFSNFKNRPAYLSTETVELTSLNYIPGHKIVSVMGRLSMHFVKESSIENYTKGPIGMPAYVISFINDMNSSIKSQIEALHGNALICMSIDHQKFMNSDRSSAYGMLSISGDVVFSERLV
ncbi:C2 domain-containing protein 5 [Smittium mucronatum]|uniref:C2 domain-containing protein 5 n=1 Tax=Smittium mucronatum TaxID=133383 RepID=A0A1R0GRV7_9FUNG|nr:C2 domain-containing protein 5 [Smittium mucronatum]